MVRSVLFLVIILFSLCLSPPQEREISIANWPYGYKSAVSISFETEAATENQLEDIASVLKDKNVNATFFVISGYYQNTPEALDSIREFEVANLGWIQASWTGRKLTYEFQKEEIEKSDKWLRERGFAPVGYRAPFLKSDEDTFRILEGLGYKYDASQYFGFLPYRRGSLIEVPLSFNFDLFWDPTSMDYSTMPSYLTFQEAYKHDDLFTFYAHATTVHDNLQNFTHFLSYLNTRKVWFATCSDIADWWTKREKLELHVLGNDVTVVNNGDEAISGVVLKIKDRGTETYTVISAPIAPHSQSTVTIG